MASRARIAAAGLLAAVALTGPGSGAAAADTQPVTDRATSGETAQTVSDRRSAARAAESTETEPRRPRCKRRDRECAGLGTPPPAPETPPETDGSDGGGLPGSLPGRVFPLPDAPRIPPPLDEPVVPDVVDTVPGVGLPLNSHVGAPVNVPVLPVAPAVAAPRPAPPAGAAPRPEAPPARPAPRYPLPARAPDPVAGLINSPVTAPASRVGYPDYLRAAGLSQIAVIALPGLIGIMVLTGAGGLVGYRQAKAGRVIAVRGAARFMN